MGGSGVDPVDDALMMYAQVSCDAAEVGAFEVELEGLSSQRDGVARMFRLLGVGTSAVSALVTGGAAGVGAGAVLFCGFSTGGAGEHKNTIDHTDPL